ncbi:hypothetical protein F4703DRAFT_1720365, partial [Phycomyces blakesleeanus]
IYTASPSNMELFCLQLLLLKVPGPTSFDNFKTVNDVQCETFQEAALALGLLVNDREWDLCLTEAGQMTSSTAAVRALF